MTRHPMPNVDIVIPTYNRARLLDRAIRSVVRQSYPHWNLWVIDDGSTDTTSETLTKWGALPLAGNLHSSDEAPVRQKGAGPLFAGKTVPPVSTASLYAASSPPGLLGSRDVTFHQTRDTDSRFPGNDSVVSQASRQIFVIKTPHQGVSAARNVGILSSQSPYLAFLDSDDEWKPDKLLRQMEYARKHPHCPLIHTNEVWIRSGKPLNQKKKHKKQGGRIFKNSLSLCLISPSSVLIQRKVFKEVGLFRSDFVVCEDYEMWLRISSRYEVGFLDEPLVIKYGGHPDQLSCQYKAMDWWRVQAMLPYLNSPLLSQGEHQQLIRVLKKKCEILLKGYNKYGHNHSQKKEIQNIYRQILKTTPGDF